MHKYGDYVLGALFVLFYAANRFNTPPTNRFSTTSKAYYIALTSYELVALFWYAALVNFPNFVGFFTGINAAATPVISKQLSFPLVASLLLTVLLPRLPYLRDMDGFLLQKLHRMASIPARARTLSARMRKEMPLFDPELKSRIQQFFSEHGLRGVPPIYDLAAKPLQGRWTRLCGISLKLEELEIQRRIANYIQIFNQDWSNLKERRNKLIPRAIRCFSKGEETDSEDFEDRLDSLETDLFDFASRAILYAGNADSKSGPIEALGYKAQTMIQNTKFSVHQILFLITLISAVVFIGFLTTYNFDPQAGGVTKSLLKGVKVSIMLTVSILCAILPKEWLRFANRSSHRPFAFYVATAAAAAVLTTSISFALESLLGGGAEAGWKHLKAAYPWAILTASLTAVTAAVCDNRIWTTRSATAQRLAEGFIAASFMALMGAATVWLLKGVNVSSDYEVPRWSMVIAVSTGLGLLVGFFLPTWYREAPNPSDPRPILRVRYHSSDNLLIMRILKGGADAVNIYMEVPGRPHVLLAENVASSRTTFKAIKVAHKCTYFAHSMMDNQELKGRSDLQLIKVQCSFDDPAQTPLGNESSPGEGI